MKHLGDIAAVDWSKVEPVDVVTGGSPCQGLSEAGLRLGLADERSGLYMEQIRCVKELREADVRRGRTGQFIRPRYMVWENVPGAFGSGKPKGADFATVIEEIIKVAEPRAAVSVCVPSGGWTKSGCYYAEDGSWSIAWRVHDAQFWGASYFDDAGVPIKLGTPQRRKRIALVADFGGLSAPEVLFERKSLRGHFEESGAEGEGTASYAERGVGADDRAGGNVALFQPMSIREENWAGAEVKNAIRAGESKSSHVIVQPVTFDARGNGDGDTVSTLTGDHENRVTDYTSVVVEAPTYCIEGNGQRESHRGDGYIESDTMYTLNTVERHAVAQPIALDRAFYNQGQNAQYAPQLYEDGTCPTLVAKGPGAVCTRYIVRRLTPLECERLQGYPDGWTDIGDWTDSKGRKRKAADAPRYKALGNSIALPFWKWLLKRISAQYERDATLGSLFDGIGGFPLCWEQINGKGTARWASEIEDFPIAVTKIRFPEEN